MRLSKPVTTEQGILYLTERTLATVAYMATIKTKSKSEYKRQKEIAQVGIDLVVANRIQPTGRIKDVIGILNCSVENWAKLIES